MRVVLRALALLQLAEKASAPQIARVIPITPQAIRRLGQQIPQIPESAHRGGYDRLVESAFLGNSQRIFAKSFDSRIAVISSRSTARYADTLWKLLHPEGVCRVM